MNIFDQKINNIGDDFNEHTGELEDTKDALLNVMEDLNKEKIKLKKEMAKSEALLESIGDGVIANDDKGKIIFINEAAESIFGWEPDKILGRQVYEVLLLEDEEGNPIPPEKSPVTMALTGTTTTTTTTTQFYIREDMTRIPVSISVAPVLLGNTIIGAIGTFRDITKEIDIDRAKTEFVSLASHQLRTPLGIVKWYIESINKDGSLQEAPEKVRECLNTVYKSNERVLSLVRNLLSISRIDQGQVKDNPQNTDIVKLLKDVVKEMNIMAMKKDVKLDLVIKSDIFPTMFIDPLRLHEVIQNLITNAIGYTKPKGMVKVIASKTDDSILISIKDTGIGISKKDQKKLFTKFFRSEKTAANSDGSGLGLYVVKSYVNDWGGKVSVESKVGKGSTFTITLPQKIKKLEPKGGEY